MLTDGLWLPTWKLEMRSMSYRMLAANLRELIMSGISGFLSAVVVAAIAILIAELRAEKAMMRTYARLASHTSIGTNIRANLCVPAAKMKLTIKPRAAWKRMRVCVRLRRWASEREAVFLMVTQAAWGRPLLRTSAMMLMYV
jgi:hypothetical protein